MAKKKITIEVTIDTERSAEMLCYQFEQANKKAIKKSFGDDTDVKIEVKVYE